MKSTDRIGKIPNTIHMDCDRFDTLAEWNAHKTEGGIYVVRHRRIQTIGIDGTGSAVENLTIESSG